MHEGIIHTSKHINNIIVCIIYCINLNSHKNRKHFSPFISLHSYSCSNLCVPLFWSTQITPTKVTHSLLANWCDSFSISWNHRGNDIKWLNRVPKDHCCGLWPVMNMYWIKYFRGCKPNKNQEKQNTVNVLFTNLFNQPSIMGYGTCSRVWVVGYVELTPPK